MPLFNRLILFCFYVKPAEYGLYWNAQVREKFENKRNYISRDIA